VGNFYNQQVFKEPPPHTGHVRVRSSSVTTSRWCRNNSAVHPTIPQVIAMAQAYYPSRTVSPVKQAFHESVFGGLHGDKQLNVEDVQEAYVESKDR
jgi:hypothetical protein